MSNRKRNMLEAFQASAREAQGEHTPHATGGAGGPFTEEVREPQRPSRPEPEAKPDLSVSSVPSLAQALARLPIGPIAGGTLVVMMLVFWLGYLAGSAPTVEAAMRETNGNFELAEREVPVVRRDNSPSPVSNRANSGTPYDRNFHAMWEDGITLRVAAYGRSERNEVLAWETHDYLLEQRMPVVTPVRTAKNIFIFVGAARSVSELGTLEDRVRGLEGPKGGQPFGDAYPVNIKDYVQR